MAVAFAAVIGTAYPSNGVEGVASMDASAAYPDLIRIDGVHWKHQMRFARYANQEIERIWHILQLLMMQLDAMMRDGGGFGAGYEIGYPCTPLKCKRLDVGELLVLE